jgi:hypothetical protein
MARCWGGDRTPARRSDLPVFGSRSPGQGRPCRADSGMSEPPDPGDLSPWVVADLSRCGEGNLRRDPGGSRRPRARRKAAGAGSAGRIHGRDICGDGHPREARGAHARSERLPCVCRGDSGRSLRQVRGALLDYDDDHVRGVGLRIWRAVVYQLFKGQQADQDYEALSYVVMDGHNYRDNSSNVNVESMEAFFDATDPALIKFVDDLITFQAAQEENKGESFAGYASLRFTGMTRGAPGPSTRAPDVCRRGRRPRRSGRLLRCCQVRRTHGTRHGQPMHSSLGSAEQRHSGRHRSQVRAIVRRASQSAGPLADRAVSTDRWGPVGSIQQRVHAPRRTGSRQPSRLTSIQRVAGSCPQPAWSTLENVLATLVITAAGSCHGADVPSKRVVISSDTPTTSSIGRRPGDCQADRGPSPADLRSGSSRRGHEASATKLGTASRRCKPIRRCRLRGSAPPPASQRRQLSQGSSDSRHRGSCECTCGATGSDRI